MEKTLTFTLNGNEVSVSPRPGESALQALRNRCQTLSLKDGCSPQGQCGCCLALVDGKAKTTCAMPADKLSGKKVLTLEGVDEARTRELQEAFVATAALQCGFCTPGIALRTLHLLEETPSPSRDEIARALDGHLCRCTGYLTIVDAVERVVRVRKGERVSPADTSGRVGTSLPRYQGEALTLGMRPYVADLEFPGMLHGAVLLSPHARARVTSLDIAAARALPGVRAVLTAADVPGRRWVGLLYADWPGLVAVGEEVRCVGDVLAVVAADDEAIAREAVRRIEVGFQVLPPLTDPEEALGEGVHQVNPQHHNLLSRSVIRRGDADAALASSAHVVRGTWKTQRIEHLFLEPEACVARPDGPGVYLYTQGQGIFDDRRQVAGFLGIPEEQVQVELIPNGGAFGGKEDMSVQAQTALLCHFTGKPVRLVLNREESIRIHPKRHPLTMHYEVGCDERGYLTAVRARMLGDSGAYASVGGKVLERAAGHACSAYNVPCVDVEALAVYTNNPPCGAMRGFGANQAAFAMEGAVDQLAEAVGLDPWEFRFQNALEVGSVFSSGQILEKSVGLKETLLAVKNGWREAREAGKAVGIACGIKNSGIGNGVPEWGKARLVVEEDETLTLYNGYTEMGQGLLTILIQCVSEVSGVPPQRIRARVDSTFALACGQTTGSRATLFAGNAAKMVGEKLREDLDRGLTLGDLRGRVYAADLLVNDTTPLGVTEGRIKTHTAFGFATQVVILDQNGRVEKVLAAHDVGRAINPALCIGQIQGSIHMGLGYALTEDLTCREGMPVTFKLRDIGVLRARDMPAVEVFLVEAHEPEGPFGAKGVGEIGLVPTAAAVAGALYAFDGRRRFHLPMRDSPAAQAMSVGRAR